MGGFENWHIAMKLGRRAAPQAWPLHQMFCCFVILFVMGQVDPYCSPYFRAELHRHRGPGQTLTAMSTEACRLGPMLPQWMCCPVLLQPRIGRRSMSSQPPRADVHPQRTAYASLRAAPGPGSSAASQCRGADAPQLLQ